MKIAISGFAGSGKTSLGEALYNYLKPKMDIVFIKPTFKDLAKKRGVSLEEFQIIAEKDPKIDIEFDNYIKEEASKHENYIVATWLAIWLVEADVRVFLFSPLEERARRVAKRDNISFEEALKRVKLRDFQNINRYKKIYGIDITDFNSQADIVINSSRYTLEKEVGIVLSSLRK